MTWIVIMVAFLSAVLVVAGIFLLNGKGSFMISGYNMMSAAKKARFIEKRVCQVTGGMVFVVAAVLAATAVIIPLAERGVIPEDKIILIAILFISLIIVTIVVGNILMYTICRRK